MIKKLNLLFLLMAFAFSLFGENTPIYENNNLEVVISEFPLGEGALRLERKDKSPFFTSWTREDHRETFHASQVIVKLWHEHREASNYMVYGREDSSSQEDELFFKVVKQSFAWEIVPFPNTDRPFWNQSKVWWNLTFGGAELSADDKAKLLEEALESRYAFLLPNKEHKISQSMIGTDAFCKKDVIDKQFIYEGDKVYLLYNYDPLGWEDKHHFLIVTKEHREKYSDLDEQEYVEAAELSQKIIKYYRHKGYPIASLCHRTGKAAGQSVPHWHLHLVLASNRTQEFIQQIQVIARSLFGHHPLSNEELENTVLSYRKELYPILTEES